MSRLIDADILLKELKENIEESHTGMMAYCDFELVDLVNDQPTAFDVDAVVSKLEMLKKRHIENAKQQRWIRHHEMCKAGCYAMAIKIVKAYTEAGERNEK